MLGSMLGWPKHRAENAAEETTAAVKDAVAAVEAKSLKDMGKVEIVVLLCALDEAFRAQFS